MPTRGEWDVELTVTGPITVRQPLQLNVEKGTRRPFSTTARIRRTSGGVNITVIVRAPDLEEADDAAIYFVGQTLDVLSLNLNLPIALSLSGSHYKPAEPHAKRIVTEAEWSDAFHFGREYGIERPVFSRALSWFRKGLTSEDPIDKLIAWWSSIEGPGSKFARSTPRTQKGAVNQVCDCFDQVWENVGTWKVIPNEAQWVNRFHEARSAIAHGFIPVDIENVREIAALLPKLRELAHAFLSDWATLRPDSETRDGNQ
jgi:hypothetical protein